MFILAINIIYSSLISTLLIKSITYLLIVKNINYSKYCVYLCCLFTSLSLCGFSNCWQYLISYFINDRQMLTSEIEQLDLVIDAIGHVNGINNKNSEHYATNIKNHERMSTNNQLILKIINNHKINIYIIANKIIFSNSALNLFTNTQLLSIFYHELAHYYNKHNNYKMALQFGRFFALPHKLLFYIIKLLNFINQHSNNRQFKSIKISIIINIVNFIIKLFSTLLVIMNYVTYFPYFLMDNYTIRQQEIIADNFAMMKTNYSNDLLDALIIVQQINNSHVALNNCWWHKITFNLFNINILNQRIKSLLTIRND